eukprot:PhF_6_TR5641/c0_g1_i2/m.8229
MTVFLKLGYTPDGPCEIVAIDLKPKHAFITLASPDGASILVEQVKHIPPSYKLMRPMKYHPLDCPRPLPTVLKDHLDFGTSLTHSHAISFIGMRNFLLSDLDF